MTRAVGLITDPRQAEQILAAGSADMVALARAFLDDPRWGWRAADALGAKAHFPRSITWRAAKAGAAFAIRSRRARERLARLFGGCARAMHGAHVVRVAAGT